MAKKIAFFLPHLEVGGMERVVLNLLTYINRELFEPSLILSSHKGSLLDLLPEDIKVTSFDGAPMRSTILRLRDHIKSQQLDVVYGGTNAANLTLILSCRAMHSKPSIIISEHTPPSLFLSNAKWRPLRTLAMKLLYPLADCLTVPAEQIALELLDILGNKAIKKATLPNPLIDSSLLSECKKRQINKGRIKLISAGRLVKLKGFDVLLDSFKILLDRGVDAELTILGEGPERANLEHQRKDLNLSKKVHLPGNVAHPIDYFKNSSIFILSSRREGFGNVIIEAMASGIPVIATDCPVGPRTILQDGRNGILVPPDNPIMLANAVADLVLDAKRIESFRNAGFQRAADFTIEKSVSSFEATALELVNTP